MPKAPAVLEDLATTVANLDIFHATAQSHQRQSLATTAAKKVTSPETALSQPSLVPKVVDKAAGDREATATVTPKSATHVVVLVIWLEIALLEVARAAVTAVVTLEATDLSEPVDKHATTVAALVTWPGTATRAEA